MFVLLALTKTQSSDDVLYYLAVTNFQIDRAVQLAHQVGSYEQWLVVFIAITVAWPYRVY